MPADTELQVSRLRLKTNYNKVQVRRPVAANMRSGEIWIDDNGSDPGAYIKDANGDLIKLGPIHMGPTPPNSGGQGAAGNIPGEVWIDTSNPNRFQTKVYNGGWKVLAGTTKLTAQATAPTGAVVGDLWYETDTTKFFVYSLSGTWLQIGGETAWAKYGTVAPAGPINGMLWFKSDTNNLYVYDGGWRFCLDITGGTLNPVFNDLTVNDLLTAHRASIGTTLGVGGALTVAGTTTFNGDVVFNGGGFSLTGADLLGIDNIVCNSITCTTGLGTGTFKNISITNDLLIADDATIRGDLGITGNLRITGTNGGGISLTNGSLNLTGGNISNAGTLQVSTISSGTISNTGNATVSGALHAGSITVAPQNYTVWHSGNFNPEDIDVGGTPLIEVPVGTILLSARPSIPSGFLVCQGQAISRVTYATLYGVIGNYYGAGDGSTTFNLPDFRNRSPEGAGNFGEYLTKQHIHTASTGGAGGHNHDLNINHTDTSHQHPYVAGTFGTIWTGGIVGGNVTHGHGGNTSWNNDHTHTVSIANTITGYTVTCHFFIRFLNAAEV